MQSAIKSTRRVSAAGFTLAEVLVANALGAIMLAALYACFAYGNGAVKLSRENLRATQILTEQMEAVRILPFTSIQGFTTNVYYDPTDQTNGNGGTVYVLTVTTNQPSATDLQNPTYYRTYMLTITATATWTNGIMQRTRSMQTYVSSKGIQPYVFQP